MRKRDTWLWVIYGFVLLFLYLISSTDLLIKERKTEIYPVSVILDDTTDESYQNFKKGVDRAAIELNADVSMITLYEGGDASQQIERMAREQQDGARALIVMPVEESALESALADKRVQIRWCLSMLSFRGIRYQQWFPPITMPWDRILPDRL